MNAYAHSVRYCGAWAEWACPGCQTAMTARRAPQSAEFALCKRCDLARLDAETRRDLCARSWAAARRTMGLRAVLVPASKVGELLERHGGDAGRALEDLPTAAERAEMPEADRAFWMAVEIELGRIARGSWV